MIGRAMAQGEYKWLHRFIDLPTKPVVRLRHSLMRTSGVRMAISASLRGEASRYPSWGISKTPTVRGQS